MKSKYYVSPFYFVPNGCGPIVSGVGSFLHLLIPDFCFGDDCDDHDYAYFAGGCKLFKKDARYLRDLRMLNRMQRRIKAKVFWRRPFLNTVAKLYFKTVRAGGEKSFNWFATPLDFQSHLEYIDLDQSVFPGLKEMCALELKTIPK